MEINYENQYIEDAFQITRVYESAIFYSGLLDGEFFAPATEGFIGDKFQTLMKMVKTIIAKIIQAFINFFKRLASKSKNNSKQIESSKNDREDENIITSSQTDNNKQDEKPTKRENTNVKLISSSSNKIKQISSSQNDNNKQDERPRNDRIAIPANIFTDEEIRAKRLLNGALIDRELYKKINHAFEETEIGFNVSLDFLFRLINRESDTADGARKFLSDTKLEEYIDNLPNLYQDTYNEVLNMDQPHGPNLKNIHKFVRIDQREFNYILNTLKRLEERFDKFLKTAKNKMENSKASDEDLKDIYLFISSSINKICKELTKFSSETMKVIEKSVYNFNKLNG